MGIGAETKQNTTNGHNKQVDRWGLPDSDIFTFFSEQTAKLETQKTELQSQKTEINHMKQQLQGTVWESENRNVELFLCFIHIHFYVIVLKM